MWTALGERIAARLSDADSLHAPHLLDAEVAQALRRAARRGDVSEERGAEALEDLAMLRVRRYGLVPLLPRIWELRANVSAYDATYLSLAEALDAPLVTTDQALKRAPGHRARIELYR